MASALVLSCIVLQVASVVLVELAPAACLGALCIPSIASGLPRTLSASPNSVASVTAHEHSIDFIILMTYIKT